MKTSLLLFLYVPLLAAGIVPDRYIVELSTEPVAEYVVRSHGRGPRARAAMRAGDARVQRDRVRGEQRGLRSRIEMEQGQVLEGVDTVKNAMVVRIPDARAASLAQMPGVRRVYPVYEVYPQLDHAVVLHHVTEAWGQVGIGEAGAGIKIAIIDTGIDHGHPGFQDAAMTAPDGFPRAGVESDLEFTNGKVIVARSYTHLLSRTDPDPSARDRVGHGTATAMAAAGIRNTGPLATITGVAPKAWLGNYKVFGSPGVNEGTTSDVVLKAIDDAVADGMDVINLSLGTGIPVRLESDAQVDALERAAALGIIVVVAAGNSGPDPATVGSPGTGPSVIAVGASNNDRTFATNVKIGDSVPLRSVPGSGRYTGPAITARVVDVASLDGSGLACAAFPAGSLSGAIAFILRGDCTFEEKLNNVQNGGAVAALVYTHQNEPDPITMGVGTATLPAQMVSYSDGIAIKERLNGSIEGTLQFTTGPAFIDPAGIPFFSSNGPNVDFTIKPDLLAVGVNLYTAAQKFDSRGSVYDAEGYAREQGTSFSAPIVAGAAALLKAARPGLTAAQYRSLLVNSAAPASVAPGRAANVQQGGGGVLDLSAAINSTVAVAPLSISFGRRPGTVNATRFLTISNVGTAAETYTLSVQQTGTGPAPRFSPETVTLEPGASAEVTVRFVGDGLAAGSYEGYILVQGSARAPARVPYWCGVPSGVPAYITFLNQDSTFRAGRRATLLLRISDAAGLPVGDIDPVAEAVSGSGSVNSIRLGDGSIPNTWVLSVQLGPQAGHNTFRVRAGEFTKDVVVLAE